MPKNEFSPTPGEGTPSLKGFKNLDKIALDRFEEGLSKERAQNTPPKIPADNLTEESQPLEIKYSVSRGNPLIRVNPLREEARRGHPDFSVTAPVNLGQGFEQTFPAPLPKLTETENKNEMTTPPKKGVLRGMFSTVKSRLGEGITKIGTGFIKVRDGLFPESDSDVVIDEYLRRNETLKDKGDISPEEFKRRIALFESRRKTAQKAPTSVTLNTKPTFVQPNENIPVLKDVVEKVGPGNIGLINNMAEGERTKNANEMLSEEEKDAAIAAGLAKLRAKTTEARNLAKNIPSLERHTPWKERLEKITKNTKNRLETTLEKLGPAGKKLVSVLTEGSEYLNSQTSNKVVKLFAAAGLVSAGALAAYATPVVLTSIAGVGLGMRIVSAAGVYAFARKQLDKKYEKWEREGKQKSALSIAGHEAAAIGLALCSGEIIGRVFSGVASMPVIQEVAQSIKNVANVDGLTKYWSNVFSDNPTQSIASQGAQDITKPVPEPEIITPLESVVTPSNPELQHVIKKGDSLWSLLRKDLAGMKLEGLSSLSQGAQERMMKEILDDITVPSGNIDKIFPGERVDFNEIDFKKYLAKHLQK